MSVGTHIIEVIRQGIWASLTGGWYYEPGFSIFCNTMHLYVWFILIILPLILGFVASQGVSLVFAASYTGFIVFFFTVIKSVVAYLHMIFDTTDPVVVTRTINDSVDELYRESEQPPLDVEMIELRDMGYNLRGSERALDGRREPSVREEIAANMARARRHLEAERHADSARESQSTPIPQITSKFWDFDESTETESEPTSSTRRQRSSPMKVVYEDEQPNIRSRSTSPPTIVTPKRKRSVPSNLRRQLENQESTGPSTSSERRSSDPTIRKKGKTDEQLDHYHEKIREKYRNIQKIQEGVEEEDEDEEDDDMPSTSSALPSSSRRQSRRRSSTGATNRKRKYTRRAGSPAVFAGNLMKKDSHESSRSMPSSVGWTPVVVSLGDVDRPTTSRYSADDADNGADIRGEITKFLEDLIDKHPETLDAIENVRMSRLGRGRPSSESHDSAPVELAPLPPSTSAGPSTSTAHQNSDRVAHGIFAVPHVLRSAARSNSFIDWHSHSQVVSSSQHHIAQGHEDTSQGAVHTFQDEDGNWWTYTFDENSGVGTAQPLGSGRAVLELIHREREKNPESARKLFPPAELEVLPESMYDSTEDEKGEKTSDEDDGKQPSTSAAAAASSVTVLPSTSNSQTQTVQLPLTRRERALSSSSNESSTYMPTLPSSVFHAPSGTGATRASSARGSQMVCFSSNGSRLRNTVRDGDDRSADSMWQMEQIMELIENTHSRRNFGPEMPSLPITNLDRRASSNVRKSYYYPMKMFPKAQKNFNLKVDRMSVDRLFDRNHTIWSLLFDIVLATIVALLAVLLIDARIFYDYSLVAFCFVVASAQFSLLKSVQPDASSPIHGFNWVASYNRPIYFCIMAMGLLYIHQVAGGKEIDENPEELAWNWNPFRLHMMTSSAILIAVRDLLSILILLLPVAFTLGWLPQFNTLAHHVAEQIEMHIFGGTASFSVFSACVQLIKSSVFYVALCVLCRVAYTFSPTSTQNPLFSTFVATSVAVSYLLSRMSSNQNLMVILFDIITSPFRKHLDSEQEDEDAANAPSISTARDEMPKMVRKTVGERARYDLIFSIFLVAFFFGLHSTSLFTATEPYFTRAISGVCVCLGVLNHYLYPQFRSHTPWRTVSSPLLKSAEHRQFESPDAAKLMYFEAIHLWMVAIERNIVYPLLIISMVTENNWAVPAPWIIIPLICLRLLRGGFSQPQLMYIPVAVACLAAAFDLKKVIDIEYNGKSLTSWNLLPIIMYICVSVFPKVVELYLKIAFILAYVAPWQISWGSAFHAFAQPFSVPHSALIAIQTVISSIISAPLNPFLGSSFFTSSYVRPVKFWEKDYNTKRTDASTMRLSSQIDRGPMLDDSNLNAVFYEHLTRSLQKSLAGDLAMGRWATSVQPGDCFVLASFYLNSLVHIIEVGNGFVTFQLRGLEFRGTYCHQREVEAITEDIRDGSGFCCCSPGSLPGFLSFNTAWNLRWLAWEVVSGKYIIDGYSISDNSAVNLLQVHELRRLLVTLYIKCIIYYTFTSTKFRQWLRDDTVQTAIRSVIENPRYTDVDSIFCSTNDEDYDTVESGISRSSFKSMYLPWIMYCIEKRGECVQEDKYDHEEAVTLCFLLSLVARRSLGTASFNRHSSAAESFLYGLHSLFKGDFRITCQRDEWVFTDMDMLRCVVSPAVKMALKLHQDHFAQFEEFDENDGLYTVIGEYQTKMFISHEQDPGWRQAILANTPSLLALRHIYDDGQDDYKIIMLNQMHLNMRVIKLNRECVRAFWAGQQQELIFLRNRNPERGSIQNARQVLRNMINSSADLPVGYPIYVSPLTTSHIESHSQIHKVFGPTFTFEGFRQLGQNVWNRLRNHFGPSGSTSAHQQQQQQQASQSIVPTPTPVPPVMQITIPSATPSGISSAPGGPNPSSGAPGGLRAHFHVGPVPSSGRSDGEKDTDEEQEMIVLTMTTPRQGRRLENSIVEMTKDGTARVSVLHPKTRPPLDDSIAAPVTLTTPPQTERERAIMNRPNFQTLLKSGQVINGNQEMGIGSWALIIDSEQIFKYLNEPLKSSGECLVVWPDELVQHMSGRGSWLFQPSRGMAGKIVYTWYPSHPLRNRRSHVGDHIHLISLPLMPNGLVPVAEKGLRLLAPHDINTLGLSGCTTQEQQEFQTRYIDVLILSKIVTGTVSARTSFPKKPPIPPPNIRDRERDRETGTSSSALPTTTASNPLETTGNSSTDSVPLETSELPALT
ncbi:Pecanex-like protein [Caenorhabditis elegans]|uniref:Pecanex-like protein n=1 Tax=Caenorhabditis elegans TaxID=6239 RepID=O61825_CAEEL|nr:Pecanex-like protein [Caenorhabditis elegans]CCD62116.1 Pecanex-like protein [Caenorhabditis elegans]|eukprot:NP_001251455.1 Uncharacterized protein CELE_B0511.12 [Caenorhabditis elegans]